MDERQKPLERWTGPTGVTTSVERSGQGTPVLFVHGQLMGRRLWSPVFDTIGTRPYASMDLPGHGESAPGEGGFERFGEAILEVAAGLQWERVVVAGHGLGALAALEAAHLSPARFAGLVLLGLPAELNPDEERRQRAIPELLKAGVPGDALAGLVERWFSADFRQRTPDLAARLRPWLLANDPAQAAGVVDRYLSVGSAVNHRYRGLATPKIIATMNDDEVAPPAEAKKTAKGWPAVTWKTLPGGHFPFFEDEEELVEVVNSGLRRADRERAEREPRTRW